ncbi:MAG: formamidopyrimidine-DNA glycosylase [Gemmataceae bacterium]|jgi:formamidopyrimidine-DNA glycosylase|nr:MAG: formamidopyrimidine-DNA glycosylase [Gemmataceae bacterium]
MPELPEVETVVRDLRPRLVGRRLVSVHWGPKPLRRSWPAVAVQRLRGSRVESIQRRGKWILVFCDSGQALRIHLGMTGQLTVVPLSEPPLDHIHWWAELDNGWQWRLRDVRRFGSVEWFPRREEAVAELEQKLGPEPLALPAGYLPRAAGRSFRCLKAVLLDQRIVAGIGNIYADEALFRAGLHPARRAASLSAKEWEQLRRAIRDVLRRAVQARGSTIRDYIGGSGLQGKYQERLMVYGRRGEPCPRCKTPIVCLRLAGRTSHFCPACQK